MLIDFPEAPSAFNIGNGILFENHLHEISAREVAADTRVMLRGQKRVNEEGQ